MYQSTTCHLFDILARAAIFVYSSAWKHKLGWGRWDLSSCQVSLNSFSSFRGEVGSSRGQVVKLLTCGARGPGFKSPPRHLNFRDWLSPASKSRYGWNTAKATRILNTTNQPTNQRSSRKCLSKSKPGRPSCFSDRPEKYKLRKRCWRDLASCQWIPFSCIREEVKSVSANQRPGWPSCFSDWPEKHKLGRRRWDFALCHVLLNSVQWFRMRSRKCLS